MTKILFFFVGLGVVGLVIGTPRRGLPFGGARFAQELGGFFDGLTRGRIDLTRRFSPVRAFRGVFARLGERMNGLVSSFGAIIRRLSAIGLELISVSDRMKADAETMLGLSDETSAQAERVATAMEEMTATVNDIARNMNDMSVSSSELKDEATSAEGDLEANVESIRSLRSDIEEWAETNRILSEGTAEISGIINVIDEIADQTNLLALNAAIEAARAGEHGRGFAVVAEEVRKLADKTTKATREIAGMVEDLGSRAARAIENMERTLAKVGETTERTESAGASIGRMLSRASGIADRTVQVAASVEEQAAVAADVSKSMSEVSGYARRTREVAENLSRLGDEISTQAVRLFSQVCSTQKDERDRRMESFLEECVRELSEKIETDLRNGLLDRGSLFDSAYQPLEGDRFRTASVPYFEKQVLPLLGRWAAADPGLIYVVVMDRNGFMPVHLLPARAGVRMQDPVSLAGAKSLRIIGQAFRRPREAGGEMVVDLAAPLHLGGEHWGCLRIGYLPDASAP